MGQIVVRDLDEQVIERLKQRAMHAGQSLEETVRNVLADAARPTRAELIAEVDRLRSRIGPVSGDSTELIREDRDNEEPHR